MCAGCRRRGTWVRGVRVAPRSESGNEPLRFEGLPGLLALPEVDDADAFLVWAGEMDDQAERNRLEGRCHEPVVVVPAPRRCPARRHTSWQGSWKGGRFHLACARPSPAGRAGDWAEKGGSGWRFECLGCCRSSATTGPRGDRSVTKAAPAAGRVDCRRAQVRSRDSLVDRRSGTAPRLVHPRRCCRCTRRGCGTRCATGLGIRMDESGVAAVEVYLAVLSTRQGSSACSAKRERARGEGNAALAVSR